MDAPRDHNPFVAVRHPIAFDRMHADGVRAAVDRLLEEAGERLADFEASTGPRTYESTLGELEALTEPLERAMTVIGHLESVATSPELREAYNDVQPRVSAFMSSIPLSAGVWRALSEFAEAEEAAALDATRARFLAKTLDDFRREGAALGDADKARLRDLNVELAQLTTRFSQNVLDSTNDFELVVEDRARLAGLPERAVEAARESAKARGKSGYRFTLQAPSFIPVLTYLDDAALREKIYRAYYARAAGGERDNGELLKNILRLRREKAELLGFDDFVDLVLSDRMAKRGEKAMGFIDDLRARTQAAFEHENRELRAFRRQQAPDAPAELAPWDVSYWAEKQRRALYDFDEEALRPYFSLERVLDGLFSLVNRLYGVRVEEASGLPTWDSSVRCYRVLDSDGSELGVFYADFFPRETKRDGAWMNAFITGERTDRGWTPHVGLICANVTPPVGGKPSLLGHREVETVFHEFGHLMHHMLSRVEVKSLAGTNVAWDFVELPSQIMENWCWERDALDLFAAHYETGERIPDDLFEKMKRARTYRGANAMMRQLGFATVDLRLHRGDDPARLADVTGFARAVLQEFAPATLQPDFAMINSFGHLFSHPVGYAGGYYSYKWAEVLDADAFSRFRDQGLFSREVGGEFRNKILSQGDSRDPMDLFKSFMGREPDLNALLERSGIEPVAAE